jgi:hypothetical protein
MKKGYRSWALALAALAALALASTAAAAYTTAKLSVTYAGTTTRIVATSAVGDDATARAAIVIPNGTTINTSAAPGTKVGTAKAQVSALALGGALLPLEGDIFVVEANQIDPAARAGCIGAAVTAQLYMNLQLQAAGQTLNLPAYIVATSGATAALGSSALVFCLPPPDIPPDKGGATFGSKFLSADLTLNGVFSPVTQGAWVGIWTPWQAGNGQLNAAGTIASPAVIAPGAITLSGRKVAGRKTLSGRLTQGGAGVVNRIQIWGAVGRAALKPIRTVTSKQGTGAFALVLPKTAKQTVFQARAVVVGRNAPALCSQFASLPVPCVNATVNGFTARSSNVTVR